MRKTFIILFLGTVLLSSMAFAQIIPVDTTLKAVDSNGVALQLNSAATVQVVLVHPLRMTNSQVFSYYGVDTATGLGINLFSNDPGGDTTILTSNPPGTRTGVFVQCAGTVGQYNGDIEIIFTGNPSDITTMGTGYSYSTNVIPSLSSLTGFDQTLQTGGEYYEGRLCRINNVHFASPGSFSSFNVTDFSGATVSLYNPAGSSFSDFTSNNPGLYDTVTSPSYNFDFIGVAAQYSGNVGPYELLWRYIPTDFIPHFGVSPAGPIYTQPSDPPTDLIVFGGFPPYTWSLSTSTSGQGSLNTTSGATVSYTPGTTIGSLQAIATDSAGESLAITINITGTSAPLVPDISMNEMAVPREVSKAVIKPTE